MPKIDYAAFQALDPFFEVVMEGLSKFVDGEHYFDTLAGERMSRSLLILGERRSLGEASYATRFSRSSVRPSA